MIRCLVVDDSPTFRAALRLTLEGEPGIAVVGEASDAAEAVRLAHELRPDVVTMDVRMPGRDGIEATREIMRTSPTRILVLSADRDLALGLGAVQAGALDVVAKPRSGHPGGFAAQVAQIRAAIESVCRHPLRLRTVSPVIRPTVGGLPPLAVGIGSSTGGPNALVELLRGLPSPFPVPILIAQHLADGFHAGLAEWLSAQTLHTVKLAEQGEPLQAGTVYLAPQDRHLGVEDGFVQLSDDALVDGFRPSATALFRSLARAYGDRAAGIVLTGMGKDGTNGLMELHQAGGFTAAQGPATSVVFGMPAAALSAGAASVALELPEIPPALMRLVQPRAGS
jgi:two-component system chemotaxis response regulator CheB